MSYPTNLVLSGGGVNGIAHVSAILELMKNDYLRNLKRIAGTSAGAMIGTALAIGYTEKEFLEFLKNLHFPNLLYAPQGYAEQANRFLQRFGRYNSKAIHDLVNNAIAEKLGIKNATFADLHYLGLKDLHIITANMSREGIKFDFCFEKTPHTSIAIAVCTSMAAPYYFAPIPLKEVEKGQYIIDAADPKAELFSDGGIVDNFALETFDNEKFLSKKSDDPFKAKSQNRYIKNHETLGLLIMNECMVNWINDKKIPAPEKLSDHYRFFRKVIEASIFNQRIDNIKNTESEDRIIVINNLDNDPFNFHIDEATKIKLFDSGKNAVLKYLAAKNIQPANLSSQPIRSKL